MENIENSISSSTYTMDFIDLRSDTVTWPTLKMRQAMTTCKLGDDVYGDDPTVIELENLAAEITAKEAALFVPTGTFGNQISIMSHIVNRGDEVIAAEESHVVQYEVGGIAVISGANLRVVKGNHKGMVPEEVESKIRDRNIDIHFPGTGLICLENANTKGKVLPLSNMEAIYNIAKKYNIPVHLDGARLFNAAIYLKVDPKEITKYCDSVSFCLSKGLCCPLGSLVCGTKEFIKRVRKNRKMLGGGMRQSGIVAICGIIALKEMIEPLADDHRIAKLMASELEKIPYLKIVTNEPNINMVFFDILEPIFDEDDFKEYMLKNNIKINTSAKRKIWRFVVHHYIREKEVEKIINLIENYFKALKINN